jgi:hypothetical protein
MPASCGFVSIHLRPQPDESAHFTRFPRATLYGP